MHVPLIDGVKPHKAKARKYPPKKQFFLETTCQALESQRSAKNFSLADWISAPVLVPKAPPGRYRATIDWCPSTLATNKGERPRPKVDFTL